MRETFSDLRSRARFLLIALATIMLPEGSPAQQTVVLDSYTCAAFLKDVKEPIDGERVIRVQLATQQLIKAAYRERIKLQFD
jgi:hypothetical protein